MTSGSVYTPSVSSACLSAEESGRGRVGPTAGRVCPLLPCSNPVTLWPPEMGTFEMILLFCTLSVSAGVESRSPIRSGRGLCVGAAAARNVGLLPGHAWQFRFWFRFWLLWVSISSFLSSDDILCLPAEYPHREKLAPRGRRSNASLSPFIYQLESHESIPSSKEVSGLRASPWKRWFKHLVFP